MAKVLDEMRITLRGGETPTHAEMLYILKDSEDASLKTSTRVVGIPVTNATNFWNEAIAAVKAKEGLE
jgi:hypothetical protein